MNILYGLTYRNLKMNKRRTIVTIIGVVLATLLISVVAILTTSLYDSIVKNEKERNGNYHVRICDVTKKDSLLYRNYREVKESFTLKEIGSALLEKSLIKESDAYGNFKGYLRILGYDNQFLYNYPLSLVVGRYPENDREILVTSDFIQALKTPYQIGDKITLEVGARVDKEGNHLLPTDLIYHIEQNEEGTTYLMKDLLEEEKIIDSKKEEYTIVGIVEVSGYAYDDPNYYLFTYSNENTEYEDIFLTYHNPDNAKTITEELVQGKYHTYSHDGLLDLLTIKLGTETGAAFGGIAGVIIVVIMVSSVLVIRNGFSISVVERTRQFGLLSSIGATPKQIRKSVLFEGMLIGIVSIPIGFLLGILTSYLLIFICNTTLKGYLDFLELSLSWVTVVVAFLPTILTIFLSCYVPSLLASRISPVEAIRNNHEIKMTKKQLKTPKIISKLFGIGGEVSYKNLKRSKKKYQTTVLSLVVSIIVFITLSSFIDIVFYVLLGYYDNAVSCDLVITTSLYDSSNLSKEEINSRLKELENRVVAIDGIDRYAVERIDYLSTSDSSLFKEDYYPYYELTHRNLDDFYFSIQISTVGEQEYERFVNSLGGKVEDYQDGAILIDKVSLEYNKKFHEMNLLNVQEGETLTLYDALDKSTREIKILKRTDKKPLSLPDGVTKEDSIYLIVSDSYMKKLSLGTSEMSIYINAKNTKPIIEKLEELNSGSDLFTYEDYQSEERTEKSIRLLVFIISYGFIGIITLIGVTNIFNTITTNMILRSREFAMLRAVGMTTKEFNKMIRLESIFYGLKSLMIGISVSLFLTYYMNTSLSKWIAKSYQFPTMTILISTLFVFIVVYMTMHYSLKQINKQNIIDSIREENI